ncbi:MAG: NlpC/P60 family protein [Pseudomonadota bacterium]
MAAQSYPDASDCAQAWQAEARAWFGTPYRHQASRRGVGADCLGFVAGVWADVYGDAPGFDRTYARSWAETGEHERLLAACHRFCGPVDAKDAQPGDLLVFRFRPEALAKHIAILFPDGFMAHAIDRRPVALEPFTAWWQRHLAGVFRPPLTYQTD